MTEKQYWGIHSEKDGQPVLRAWATSEAEAKTLADRIEAQDGDRKDDSYWCTPLSARAVAMAKQTGFIPHDA